MISQLILAHGVCGLQIDAWIHHIQSIVKLLSVHIPHTFHWQTSYIPRTYRC